MAGNGNEKKVYLSLAKKTAIFLLCIYTLYVAAVFLVVPPLLKPRLEIALSDQIGRNVTIDEIKFNPFVLSATVANLRVHEKDGEPFFGFEQLFADIQLASVAKWAVTFKTIRLLEPFGVVKLLPGNKSNIDDLLVKFGGSGTRPDPEAGLPPVIISNVQVVNGRFSVDDLTGEEAIRETLSPITFTLENLTTLKQDNGLYRFVGVGPSGGQYLFNGQASVNPIRIEGSFSAEGIDLKHYWNHVAADMSLQIIQGKTGVSGNYLIDLSDATFNAVLQNGEFEIADFQLTEKGNGTVLFSLPSLSVKGISADLKTRQIEVNKVESADGRVESWLAPDGTFKLRSLLMSDLQKLSGKKSESAADNEKSMAPPWQASIDSIAISDWGVILEDRTLPKPVRFTIDKIRATIDNLSNQKGSRADVSIELQLNQTGEVNVSGAIGIAPIIADVKVVTHKIALTPFQAYAETAVNARIVEGTTSSDGRILYQTNSGSPQLRYVGRLRVDGLEIKDNLQPDDLIRLAQIEAADLQMDLKPNKLQVAKVFIDQFFARIEIAPDGKVNVVQIFSPAEKTRLPEQENLLKRLVRFLTMQIEGPVPVVVDQIQFNDFSFAFVDESVTPRYATRLDLTRGFVSGLSSDPAAQADFQMAGALDQSATLEVAGRMNPLHAFKYTKVDLAIGDFDLKSVSPYSGKFVGYGIDRGKLNLKLKYVVDRDKIEARNRIEIDKLELGKKVDSREAIDLPVALGVAMLKDSNGRIVLEVPVQGEINDPHFNFGQTVKGVLTKKFHDVAQSPFSAIDEIGGIKGEELRYIVFAPGMSELSAEALQKLNALSRFMNERKELTVDVEGIADRRRDGAVIAARNDGTEKAGENARAEKQYISNLPTASKNLIEDEQLKQLALKRAKQVQAHLSGRGEVPAKRIQNRPVRISGPSENSDWGVELYLNVY